MDRVNRSFLLASTLLAVPAALLMASLTTGTTPDVQHAVGQTSDDSGAIQQVVGKQPKTVHGRPGLLQVLAGSRSKGNPNHHHQNMPQNEPKGLFDGLFDGSKRTTHSHASHPTRAASVSRPRSSGNSKSADWDGIPYHQASNSGSTDSSKPIRDPNTNVASDSGKTRIIRGGSSRSIQATPASVRRPSGPTVARQPVPALLVPEPPQDVAPIPSSARNLSTSSSSRRSGRRSVDALDASEIAAASKAPTLAVVKPQEEVADLVPRVVRKEVRAEEQEPAAKTTKKPVAKSVAASTTPESAIAKSGPAPSSVAQKSVAKSENKSPVPSQAAQVKPVPAAPQVVQPEAQTALAAIGAPTPSPTTAPTPSPTPSPTMADEPESAGDFADAAPTTSLASPPTYTTPVDPATAPLPPASVPSYPYAASTPSPAIAASPASHRAGPPVNAFGPGQIASMPPQHAPAPPVQQPYGQPQFNAASTPVGSGVVPNGDVASYRRPAPPVYETAQRPNYPGYPNVDPYANQDYSSAGRMTTYGQPVKPTPSPATTGTRPVHETAAVPMQPIYPQAAPNAPASPAADNFSRSTYDSRNQMRDASGSSLAGETAASSELPGIRVVTHGPSAIMIRQTSEYEIRVENRGSIDATGVLVRALIPDWADIRGQNATRGDIDNQVQGSSERLVWTIDHLPAGASEKMFVRLTAARSGTYDLDVDWTLLPQKSVAKVQVREPRLDLTIEGPEEVIYGQSQTYKVRVLNPGDGTAPNVVFTLSPNSATPQTQRIGDIPPGKEAQFDVELTAQDLGDLKIHGLASGDLELRSESTKTIRVAAAKIEAVLSGPELKYQNTDAMYALQLQNSGAATSERVVATLRLPTGAKYLGGIEEAVMQGGMLKWEIKSLAPGATRNYQFNCNMASTGEHVFVFDCKGTAAGNAGVSIATRVESIADLVLSVSDPTAPAPIGSDVTYEIVIRNRGSKEATDVRAVAQFSHGIEPQRIEGQSGEVVTGQVLFDTIPRIAAGQEVRMRVIAQADRAGHHRFRTEVRSGDTVLVAEEATHYMSPKSDRVSRRSSDAANR